MLELVLELVLVLLLPWEPVLLCQALKPSSGALCCSVLLLPALLACEACGLEMSALTLIEEHGLVLNCVAQPERLVVDVAYYQTDPKYPTRRGRCRSLESFYVRREVQRTYARSTMLKSPLAAAPESEPLPMPKHPSCIEQSCRADQLSYTLARYRLCIIAIVRHLTN